MSSYDGRTYYRFFKNLIKKDSGCWEWEGSRDKNGYGICSNRILKERRAHRASFRLFIGEIPNDLVLRHSCHNPPCCNPDHLKVGTVKDNARDCVEAGRSTKGFKNGRCKLTEEEYQYIVSQKGKIFATKLARHVSINSSQIYNIWNGDHKYDI